QARTGQRAQELETQLGMRTQEKGNFDHLIDQEEADISRSSHRNQQMLSEISGKRQLAEIEQMRRGRAMQALMMQSGAGVDDQQVLTQLFQTNPAVYGELEG